MSKSLPGAHLVAKPAQHCSWPAQPATATPLSSSSLPGGRARTRRARPRAPATSSLLRPPPASLLASTTPWRRHAAPTNSLTLPYLSLRPYPLCSLSLTIDHEHPRAPTSSTAASVHPSPRRCFQRNRRAFLFVPTNSRDAGSPASPPTTPFPSSATGTRRRSIRRLRTIPGLVSASNGSAVSLRCLSCARPLRSRPLAPSPTEPESSSPPATRSPRLEAPHVASEHAGGLGSELRWLWPRPRHGRRRETLGRGGRWG